MALTQQEILETRKRLGIPEAGVTAPPVNNAAQNVARRRQLAAEYDAKQKSSTSIPSQIVGNLKNTFLKGAQDVTQDIKNTPRLANQIAGGDLTHKANPNLLDKSLAGLSTVGHLAGDVAKTTGGIIGSIISPFLSQSVKEHIAQGNQKFLESTNILGQKNSDTLATFSKIAEANPEVAQSLGDVFNTASLLGGKKAISQAKETAKETLTDVGESIVKTSDEIASKSGQLVDKVVPQATKVVKDIVPTRGEMISGQITKALDLTQGDVSNIKLSTKNDVGTWISDKNLIGGNKKETVAKIKELTDTQYKAVREEIKKVPTVYKSASVPRVRESLSMLSDDLKGVLGQEKAASEVNALLKKKTYKLEDVQRVKELLDDQFDLYKATGDVKAGQTKAGLANVRGELKTFIEKEVKDNTGADIRGMNNDVSTGKSILKLAEKRSTRDFTRANISLSDLGAFGGGSILGTPLLGAAAFVVKRIVETPTMRLKFAQFLKSLPKKEVEIIKNTLLKGEVPEQINAFEKVNNFLKDRAGLTMKEIKEIDSLTKNEMIDAIDYIRLKKPFDQAMEESIGKLTEKFGIQYKDLNKVSDAFENLVETTKTKDVGGKVIKK